MLDMAPDCHFNITGLATTSDNSRISLNILTLVITLFVIPLFTRLQTSAFHHVYLYGIFYHIYYRCLDIIQGINSIIQVAQECRKIRSQQIRQPKKFRQTLPPADKTLIIPDLPNLQLLLLQPQSSQPSGDTPVPNVN